MAPRFDLERVQEAARDGRISLTRKRALDHLTPFIPTWEGCRSFAIDVICQLRPTDFYETREQRDTCDVYGVELPLELLEKHGVPEDCRTWYVKFTVQEGNVHGDLVVFISLHRLEWSMEAFVEGAQRGRRGGRLDPSW